MPTTRNGGKSAKNVIRDKSPDSNSKVLAWMERNDESQNHPSSSSNGGCLQKVVDGKQFDLTTTAKDRDQDQGESDRLEDRELRELQRLNKNWIFKLTFSMSVFKALEARLQSKKPLTRSFLSKVFFNHSYELNPKSEYNFLSLQVSEVVPLDNDSPYSIFFEEGMYVEGKLSPLSGDALSTQSVNLCASSLLSQLLVRTLRKGDFLLIVGETDVILSEPIYLNLYETKQIVTIIHYRHEWPIQDHLASVLDWGRQHRHLNFEEHKFDDEDTVVRVRLKGL